MNRMLDIGAQLIMNSVKHLERHPVNCSCDKTERLVIFFPQNIIASDMSCKLVT